MKHDRSNLHLAFGLSVTLLACSVFASSAHACSVCFGDPESKMTQGAVWGVITLVVVVVMVLGGIAGTGLFWIHRSRKLAAGELLVDDAEGAFAQPAAQERDVAPGMSSDRAADDQPGAR